jgi:hypothetical protein
MLLGSSPRLLKELQDSVSSEARLEGRRWALRAPVPKRCCTRAGRPPPDVRLPSRAAPKQNMLEFAQKAGMLPDMDDGAAAFACGAAGGTERPQGL